jgi:hypothetical protein
MRETQLKKLLKKEFETKAIAYYFAPRVKWQSCDIFGVYDVVTWDGYTTDFIQITTLTNVSHRKRKIFNFFKEKMIVPPHHSYIYAYDEKTKDFRRIHIFGNLPLDE